jgi:hypothetical protein
MIMSRAYTLYKNERAAIASQLRGDVDILKSLDPSSLGVRQTTRIYTKFLRVWEPLARLDKLALRLLVYVGSLKCWAIKHANKLNFEMQEATIAAQHRTIETLSEQVALLEAENEGLRQAA